jgi:hypothetical protein
MRQKILMEANGDGFGKGLVLPRIEHPVRTVETEVPEVPTISQEGGDVLTNLQVIISFLFIKYFFFLSDLVLENQ